MAGPMQNWDPIFIPTLFLGIVTTLLAATGIFIPQWFTITAASSDVVINLLFLSSFSSEQL